MFDLKASAIKFDDIIAIDGHPVLDKMMSSEHTNYRGQWYGYGCCTTDVGDINLPVTVNGYYVPDGRMWPSYYNFNNLPDPEKITCCVSKDIKKFKTNAQRTRVFYMCTCTTDCADDMLNAVAYVNVSNLCAITTPQRIIINVETQDGVYHVFYFSHKAPVSDEEAMQALNKLLLQVKKERASKKVDILSKLNPDMHCLMGIAE